eukprot:TRINITY_DN13545_c0_g1_i12.p2 TRINITY_DN13545_c0_g1~~TRINITY_DN13545_c0_g1_i12.p2  ORF type:complete len:152 (-),score=18.84 TRINITY_DN13545_c0_g1_i12:461-916(-)
MMNRNIRVYSDISAIRQETIKKRKYIGRIALVPVKIIKCRDPLGYPGIPRTVQSTTDKSSECVPSIPRCRSEMKVRSCSKHRAKKKPFVLNCCKPLSVLPSYNGLRDKSLYDFFNRPSMRRHLISMKMVYCAVSVDQQEWANNLFQKCSSI